MPTVVHVMVNREQVWLAPPSPTPPGSYSVPGREEQTVTWISPQGLKYVWQGSGDCVRMLPVQGAFGDAPEMCPPDWKCEISTAYSSQTLYDLSPKPADIFVIRHVYPYLACPHCQGLHRASYWHSPDWDETGTVRTCPHCNEVRDTELVYEVLPLAVLWECCHQNMIRKQEAERAKWDLEFSRLYALQAKPANPCANAYE